MALSRYRSTDVAWPVGGPFCAIVLAAHWLIQSNTTTIKSVSIIPIDSPPYKTHPHISIYTQQECIISGLLSVMGLKVLHIDRNNYYGGDCASLNLTNLYAKVNFDRLYIIYVCMGAGISVCACMTGMYTMDW